MTSAPWSRMGWGIWWLRFSDREAAMHALQWARDREMAAKVYDSPRGVVVALTHHVDDVPEIEAAWGRSKRYRRVSDVR